MCGRDLTVREALVAAVISSLHPYLIWHDVHLNREILDEILAAAVVLLTLLITPRPTLRIAALLALGRSAYLSVAKNHDAAAAAFDILVRYLRNGIRVIAASSLPNRMARSERGVASRVSSV